MKNTVLISIFCIVNYTVNSQITAVGGNGAGTNNSTISFLLGDIKDSDSKRNIQSSQIQGSAYTSEEFLLGNLYFKDEKESRIFYRYNAYAEELEIKEVNVPDAPIRGLNRDKSLSVITPDGKAIVFKTFIDRKGLTQNGYLTKLSDGKYSLYKRYDVKYTQPQKAQNSFIPAQPARFTKFTEYYIEIEGNNRIDEVEMSNRKLLKIVESDKKESLKQFLKENSIRIKNEKDVFEVLTFLNK